MEYELFDLGGQIIMFMQTMRHSSEEEQTLAALQEWEVWLMSKAERLWKQKAEVWQGISIPESNPKSSKQEAAEKVEQHQTLGREKASPTRLSPPPVTASTTRPQDWTHHCCGSAKRGISLCPLGHRIWQKRGVPLHPLTCQSQWQRQPRRIPGLKSKNLP